MFINLPVKYFEIYESHFLKFLKNLYGLCVSWDPSHATVSKLHSKYLGMYHFGPYDFLYRAICDGRIRGLSEGYADYASRSRDNCVK